MFRVWPTRKRAIKTSGHFPHPLQLVTYGIGWVLSPHFTLKLISSLVPLNRGWAIYREQIIESRYIGIFQIIAKIIDIGNLNLEVIDKLSISENASNLVR